jgi:glucarate dehydratase
MSNVHGGIGHAIHFASAGAAMSVDFCLDSGDSGIASAAYLDISAALASIRKPSQSLFSIQPLDVIEDGPCRPLDSILVPKDVTLAREIGLLPPALRRQRPLR